MPRYRNVRGRPKTRSKTHTMISQGYGNRPKKKATIKSRGALRNTGKPRGWNLKKGFYQGDYGRFKAKDQRQRKRREIYRSEMQKSMDSGDYWRKGSQFRKEWSPTTSDTFPKRRSHQKQKKGS